MKRSGKTNCLPEPIKLLTIKLFHVYANNIAFTFKIILNNSYYFHFSRQFIDLYKTFFLLYKIIYKLNIVNDIKNDNQGTWQLYLRKLL